ncbi:hypothetical protein ARMSODRAFT_1020150 [Armillaria solidipes]|uniref:Uncharacterized protein n=1 Tax=Armillaria solidipes TaxID=1076256 RepID=A0A2H3BU81_9AGAR|nr:hypothetical protein ARMSODRAFT_1020150 [Armillaria solidipes]
MTSTRDDRHDAGDAATAMGGPIKRDSNGGLKPKVLAPRSLKPKQPSPLLSGPVPENLKGPSQLPARAQAKAAKPAGHGAESLIDNTDNDASTATPSRPEEGVKIVPLSTEWHPCRNNDKNDKMTADANQRLGDALTRHEATVTKTAIGQEAVSAQTVKRGHTVVMVEVPNKEDDTSFRIYQMKVAATNADTCRPSPKRKGPHGYEAGCPSGNDSSESEGREAAKHAPLMDTQGWLKPFEVDWTLRTVQKAQTDNATRAVLFVWVHKDQTGEITDELLSELKKGGEIARERLYELCKPIHYI